MSFRNTIAAFAAVLTVSGGLGLGMAHAAGGSVAGYTPPHVEHQKWSFSGLTGRFDRAQLKRGFLVYNQVCANCHGMKLLSYRNLLEEGGPEFTKAEVEAFIAEKQVPAEPNDDGEIFKDGARITRPALLTDRFVSPFANDKAAMVANGGSLPPDLSVMAKARGIPHFASGDSASNPLTALVGGVKEYVGWIVGTAKDIATQYQEGGADYVYALMMGYADEVPAGIELPEGKSFNAVFPGFAISMPPQIMDDLVTYEDGTKATKDQIARDISAFMMWAAEPHLEARKSLGLKVLIYLLVLSALMYAVKRTLWSGVKH